MMEFAEKFGAWTLEHFGWLVDFLMGFDPAVAGWVVLGGFLTLTLGWNILAAYVNHRSEIYNAEWMDAELWEVTEDV